MPIDVTFDLPYTQWNWQVGFYIAMIGIAGGAYLAGYVADLLSYVRDNREHGQIAQYGYLIGLGGVTIGPPILLSHLATPFRAMLLPLTMTNLGSWMALGAYMLGGFGVGAFVMFVWVAFGRERPHAPPASRGEHTVAADGGRDVASDGGSDPAQAATGGGTAGGVRSIVGRVGLLDRLDALTDYTRPSEPIRLGLGAFFGIFAFGVLLYSAMAYGSGMTERVALWNKTFLVPVQILGGLAAGLTAAVGLAALSDRSVTVTLENYALAASGLLVATLAAIGATIVMLPAQVPDAAPAVNNMVSTYAVEFVGVAVVGGILLPVVLSLAAVFGRRSGSLSPSGAIAAYATAGLLAAIGKVTLAVVYLLAAEFTPMPLPM